MAVSLEAVAAVEELDDEAEVVGAAEDLEDGVEGGARVVEAGLVGGPVEELEARVEVVARVAEDVEDELLREAEAEGGEVAVESSVVIAVVV